MNYHRDQSCRRGRASRLTARATLRSALAAAACLLALHTAAADERAGFGALPPGAVDLLEAAPPATPTVDPKGRYLLLAHRHGLLDRRQLTARSISVVGRRVDPKTHGPHAPLNYHGISVIDVATGERSEVPLPRDAVIGFPVWSPDGARFAFTLTTSRGVELWIGEPGKVRAHRLVDELNAVFSRPCVWLPDSRHVLCRRVKEEAGVMAEMDTEPVFTDWSLVATSAGGRYRPGATHDAGLERLIESHLQIIDVASGQQRSIDRAAAVVSMDPAPGGNFLLVTRIREPYPRAGDFDNVDTSIEIWDGSGRVVAMMPGSQRAVQWQAGQPATLVWVEREAGRDRLMAETPPFSGTAEQLFATGHRFAGLDWLEGTDAALLSEYLPGRRLNRRWLIHAGADPAPPRLLGSHHIDGGSGMPMRKRDSRGKEVVAVHDRRFFLGGEIPTDSGGTVPYVDEIDLDTGVRRRVWTRDSDGLEKVVAVFPEDAHRLLTRYETADTPPDYYLVDRTAGSRVRLTHNTHPAPAMQQVEQVPLRYARDDGLALSATLYVPPREEVSAPLPLVLWAYPKEVGARAPSGSPSTQRYMGSSRAMKLFFLLSGYAVMDDVSMPVAAGDRHANDNFVEQVVANARAAVDAAADTGLIDPDRVAVAGHSYGAFMAANLLAHSQLFRAGAALSGAYNRTLTPFGFQTERRTLWEAPETYLTMSPLLYSDRIQAPLLLVHGTADDNAGTSPLQSVQFHQAIRGTGGDSELLLLPGEGHTYRARESVIETASAMLDWFERHLKARPHRNDTVDSSVALTDQR